MKRVAVFLVGGIGAGIASQGVPAISAITRALADSFRLVVYSLIPPDAGFSPARYSLATTPRALSNGATKKLRWAWLASRFLADHARDAYDAVFSFGGHPMGFFAVALARLVRRPSVVVLLGAEAARVPSIGYGQLRRPVSRRLVLETCTRASSVVTLSHQQRDTLYHEGLKRRDVEVIPFGCDSAQFPFERKIRRGPLKILHVANLTEVKDQATLIRGFDVLQSDVDARLRVVGPDHMNGRLKRLVSELGLEGKVEFAGPVPYDVLPSHHRWADMFVLTSLSEGQNSAASEAAMSGLLLAGTPVGCIHDLGEQGAVVLRFGDPDDLARRIRDISGDPQAWERKAAFAHAWAKAHDLRWTVARLETVLHGLT